jgi:hypothetical protein
MDHITQGKENQIAFPLLIAQYHLKHVELKREQTFL